MHLRSLGFLLVLPVDRGSGWPMPPGAGSGVAPGEARPVAAIEVSG